jgi:hypothetical protein
MFFKLLGFVCEYESITAMNTMTSTFWHVTPCTLQNRYQCFGRKCCFNTRGRTASFTLKLEVEFSSEKFITNYQPALCCIPEGRLASSEFSLTLLFELLNKLVPHKDGILTYDRSHFPVQEFSELSKTKYVSSPGDEFCFSRHVLFSSV